MSDIVTRDWASATPLSLTTNEDQESGAVRTRRLAAKEPEVMSRQLTSCHASMSTQCFAARGGALYQAVAMGA